MKIIYEGRQTGRTMKLIELAAEAEENGEVSYIVCHTQAEAHRVFRLAVDREIVIGHPISFDEFLGHQYYGANISKFFIDNADFLIQRLTPVTVDTVVFEKADVDSSG